MTAGYFLVGLAVVLFILEAHLATYGLIGAAAIGCLIAGAALLNVPVAVIVVAALALAGLVAVMAQRAWRARHEPVRTRHEGLVGQLGEVRSPLDPEGQVFLQGTLWRARLENGGGEPRPGDRVTVQSVEGLTLLVSPASRAERDQGES